MSGHSSSSPVWSPDGRFIAFDSDRADPDPSDGNPISEVYSMAPDGSQLHQITNSKVDATEPAYSPDGSAIAYGTTTGIVVFSVNGAEVRSVTSVPAGFLEDTAPRFSPDGKQLAFVREKSATERGLFVIGVDGTGLRQLSTPGIFPGRPAWSADGTRLVFGADAPNRPLGSIWRINADGSGLVNLTPTPTVEGASDLFADPTLAPGGGWIMLLHGLAKSGALLSEGLAVMRPDGSGLTFVADGRGGEHQPDWNAVPCR